MNQLLIFITTFIIQFVISVEMNLIGILAPFLSQHFSIDESLVIRFSLGYSAVAILVPYLGVLADRHGKKINKICINSLSTWLFCSWIFH